jgi:hypothetical protein
MRFLRCFKGSNQNRTLILRKFTRENKIRRQMNACGFHKSSVPHPFIGVLTNGWETSNLNQFVHQEWRSPQRPESKHLPLGYRIHTRIFWNTNLRIGRQLLHSIHPLAAVTLIPEV